ncbi:MAG: hydroxyacid dehydrogenase [Acidimicrobiia bacterium]|nr:hydroxyacid dehydrogenase [Acidimicrobiia bacterium]
MSRIVVTEFMDEAPLGLASDHDVMFDPDLHGDRPALLAAVAGAEAVIVRNKTRVDTELLDAAPNLRVVGRLGVGLDNIDMDACADRGVTVRPATGANAIAVAEWVLGAMLVLRRGVFGATERIASGEWPRTELLGGELNGATLGLVGYGGIAREVATRAAAFGMRIVAHDPYVPDGADWAPAAPASLEAVLSGADVISLHVPLTDETRGLIDMGAIASMKDTAIVINSSRGGIVDETAAVAALHAGRLGGVALDVLTEEPPSADRAWMFLGVPNLLLSPHVAGITHEANVRVSRMTVEAVLEELAR